MEREQRTCQNCKATFFVESDDFAFYEKMAVPPPTWCPECRMMRRFAFLNLWNLYKRPCAKCGASVVSIYSPDKENVVYCMPCWWADDWDGLEYGMDYDPSRPFLNQVKDLARRTPWQTLEADYLTNKNCDYASGVGHCKDSYLIFWADFCENAYYSTFLNTLKDSLDCYRMNNCELCYECIGGYKCYRTFYSEECDACTDVWFSRSCSGCTNCFGCINLRSKSYCIFNEQYSREDYLKQLAEMDLGSRRSLAAMRGRVEQFWNKHPYRAYNGNNMNVGVTGDMIYESKNTQNAYMVTGAEDSKFIQFVSVAPARDCWDYSGWGNNSQRIYESALVGEGTSDAKFCFECWPDALDNEYSIYAVGSKHILGCINLKRKDYCILNKQYSKEEYERLAAQIKKDMAANSYIDTLGRKWLYGEFLPIELSRFAYNETLAGQFFPKTKDEALRDGFRWYEGEASRYAATIKGGELPDVITVTEDSVLSEVVGCDVCGKAYKIIPGELNLMRNLGLPLPSTCWQCRQKRRFARTNPPRLYDRSCAKCGKSIKTSYAPDRSETVYCEQCYQAEVA